MCTSSRVRQWPHHPLPTRRCGRRYRLRCRRAGCSSGRRSPRRAVQGSRRHRGGRWWGVAEAIMQQLAATGVARGDCAARWHAPWGVCGGGRGARRSWRWWRVVWCGRCSGAGAAGSGRPAHDCRQRGAAPHAASCAAGARDAACFFLLLFALVFSTHLSAQNEFFAHLISGPLCSCHAGDFT